MDIVKLIIEGLSIGSLYALIAIAMVIIYKTSEVPNFAQGEMAMISTFVVYHFMEKYGFSFLYAFIGSIIISCIIGILFEFLCIRRAKEPNVLDLILITLGFERILYGFAGWKWGAEQKTLTSPITVSDTIQFGSLDISKLNIIIIIAALLIMILFYIFFRYSKLGIAMKATQQNQMAARINGIRTNRIMSFTWALSSVIGAVAGVLLVSGTGNSLDSSMMLAPLLKGFAAAVLGGMTSLIGSIGGGFILGIIEKLFGFYISFEFETVVSFVVIVVVLWFKPEGIFSRHYRKKV